MMRRVVIAMLFLASGVVVNIAVAWSCAYWIDGGRCLVTSAVRGNTALEHPRWQVLLGRRPGAIVIRSDASGIPPPPVPLPPDATPEEMMAWMNVPTASINARAVVSAPRWSRASTPPGEADYEQRAVWEDARGWPMVCLVSYSADFGGRAETPWALDLGGAQGPMGLPRVLPLRPILISFAGNSVAYAAVLWGIVLGPGTARRFIRRRRHLCPACGYPVGKSELCTECGRAVSR
ncbi:MAG: hypothetical protein ACYTFF_19180 [Planctomycetota bacterium]